jgi:hypothetical protein
MLIIVAARIENMHLRDWGRSAHGVDNSTLRERILRNNEAGDPRLKIAGVGGS